VERPHPVSLDDVIQSDAHRWETRQITSLTEQLRVLFLFATSTAVWMTTRHNIEWHPWENTSTNYPPSVEFTDCKWLHKVQWRRVSTLYPFTDVWRNL